MKHRTKKRIASVLVAALAAAFATAVAAQSTETPREGGIYQFGDANRANGSGNGPLQPAPDDRRQSGYPQPGTAADANGIAASHSGTQDTTVRPAPGTEPDDSPAPGK